MSHFYAKKALSGSCCKETIEKLLPRKNEELDSLKKKQSEITDEVKECLEIYNFNNRKEDKEYECHFCATACVVNKEKNKILFIQQIFMITISANIMC